VPDPPPARHLLRARDLADGTFDGPVTVADMAGAAALSPAHFSRAFRTAFGESPHQYLLTRRLERAATLLRTTDRSVTDIAIAVGWSSLGSFSATFRRVYGTAPSTWRVGGAGSGAGAEGRVPSCTVRTLGRRRNRTFREAPDGPLP
jgi:transcriptional regulator GlxA family with amidase domain